MKRGETAGGEFRAHHGIRVAFLTGGQPMPGKPGEESGWCAFARYELIDNLHFSRGAGLCVSKQ